MKFRINYKKFALISVAAICFTIINGYLIFPSILKVILKHVSKAMLENLYLKRKNVSKLVTESSTQARVSNATIV